jgi:cyclopropane-fatty-acyl-phospholipid synthase
MTIASSVGLQIMKRLTRHGTLDVALPDGTTAVVGHGEPRAAITIHDRSAVGDILRMGLMGFAEAHMDGRIDTPDLPALLAWGVANQESWFDHPLTRATSPIRKGWQRIRPELRHRKVRTINDHYNLSNDFYASWLDETMTYSAARFAHPSQSLAEAQRNKYRTIADHAGLRPGMRVLEIGCGWGGFAEYAAVERGCTVEAITLAEEHAAYARKRMAGAGITDLVDVAVCDFRDVTGTFDAVVSIEMIESVDERHWPGLFATMARSLVPGGLAAMQIITIDDAEWQRYRSRADFIQQYIFPGGQLPAPKILHSLADGAGLAVEQVETFGLDYARTLDHWRTGFEAEWPRLRREHDLDERFRRMWDLYLSLCAAGFRTGRIDVQQWVFRRQAYAA